MEKAEILKLTLKYLKENPYTQTYHIRNNIESILEERGIVGTLRESSGGFITTSNVRMSNEVELLINVIVYDLMYRDRVITPGVNRDNLKLPFLHVSDMDKLNQLLEELS